MQQPGAWSLLDACANFNERFCHVTGSQIQDLHACRVFIEAGVHVETRTLGTTVGGDASAHQCNCRWDFYSSQPSTCCTRWLTCMCCSWRGSRRILCPLRCRRAGISWPDTLPLRRGQGAPNQKWAAATQLLGSSNRANAKCLYGNCAPRPGELSAPFRHLAKPWA